MTVNTGFIICTDGSLVVVKYTQHVNTESHLKISMLDHFEVNSLSKRGFKSAYYYPNKTAFWRYHKLYANLNKNIRRLVCNVGDVPHVLFN